MIGKEYIDKDSYCAYFDDRLSSTKYWYLQECSANEYQGLLEHGWRRFGKLHFTPICSNCNECKSIRICVDEFEFSKSQKRVLRKNKDTQVVIQHPTCTDEHIVLYNKYHEIMHNKKSWKFQPIDQKQYINSYVEGYNNEFEYEFLYYRDGKLIGVALVDILSSAISSIYCFYDHDYAKFSVGQFSILTQIKIAKYYHIPHIYLGYWMKDHYSMGYKEKYKPFEVLSDMITPLEKLAIWNKYN